MFFKGKTVQLAEGLTAEVFPLAFRHLKSASERVSTLFAAVQRTGGALESVIPIVLTDCLDLLKQCCVLSTDEVTFDDLPARMLPELAAVWIEESIPEGSTNPMTAAFSRIKSRLAAVAGRHSSPQA